MSGVRIAVVDDEPITCREIARILTRQEHQVETFLDGASALERLSEAPFEVMICDLRLPDMDGLHVLAEVKQRWPAVEVIILTAYSSVDTAVEAIHLGAFHYVTKPIKGGQLQELVGRAVHKARLSSRRRAAQDGLGCHPFQSMIIGESAAMRKVLALIEKVAPLNCNVLLQGESGTGKEMVAKAIHVGGPRRDNPFIPFHCGSFADDLVPNELFGHEKGAFTGATERKIGLLEAGHRGTVFLDEIATMPAGMQVKLLRFIQERSLLRLGGTEQVQVDVRLIAASNKDLKVASEAGAFRRDLYYRLNVVDITLPPLRERMGDVPILARHFLAECSEAFGKHVDEIAPDTMSILSHYPFPGNVRELENIIERAVALADGPTILPKDLPPDLQQLSINSVGGQRWMTLAEKERQYIQQVLVKTAFNRAEAARVLSISRTTLWRKMKQLGLA